MIADQVAEAMLGRRRTLDTTAAERDGEKVRSQLSFERKLDEDLRRLERSYDQTLAEQQLTPDHIQATDMRHSTASIMAARGERPEVIQRVMRHSKVSFTIDRYVKVYRDDVRDAVQRNDRRSAAR